MLKSLINFPVVLFQSLSKLISNAFKWFSEKVKQPARTSVLSLRGLIVCLGVTLFVSTIWWFLTQTGSTAGSGQEITQLYKMAGLTFAGMLICLFVLPLVLSSFYDEHEWTVGKQIIQQLLMVLVAGGGLIFFLNLSQPEAAKLLAGLLLLSIIPVILFSFFLESQLTQKFSSGAQSAMSNLGASGVVSHDNPLKVLVFKDGADKLSLVPNQLIYVKTGKDQSEFYYQNFFGVESTVMAVDEKKVAEELNGHPQFDQFRQDHYININGIKNITGTARGYEISIAKVNHTVKVSRKYTRKLENL